MIFSPPYGYMRGLNGTPALQQQRTQKQPAANCGIHDYPLDVCEDRPFVVLPANKTLVIAEISNRHEKTWEYGPFRQTNDSDRFPIRQTEQQLLCAHRKKSPIYNVDPPSPTTTKGAQKAGCAVLGSSASFTIARRKACAGDTPPFASANRCDVSATVRLESTAQ